MINQQNTCLLRITAKITSSFVIHFVQVNYVQR